MVATGIATRTHHHDAAHHPALAVQVSDAAAHLGPNCTRDVGQPHGHAAWRRSSEAQRAGRPATAGSRSRAPCTRPRPVPAPRADGAVGMPARPRAPPRGQPVGLQAGRIEHDLVLAHHAAQRGHLGHVGTVSSAQSAQEPVLQGPQLPADRAARGVYQGVLVDPAQPRRVGGRGPRRVSARGRRARAWPRYSSTRERASTGRYRRQHVDEGLAAHRTVRPAPTAARWW